MQVLNLLKKRLNFGKKLMILQKMMLSLRDKNREDKMLNSSLTIFSKIQYSRGVMKLLSRDCDGCSRMVFECKQRFGKVAVWEKVFCPDGTAHLVDV
jgi:hypothetical protein